MASNASVVPFSAIQSSTYRLEPKTLFDTTDPRRQPALESHRAMSKSADRPLVLFQSVPIPYGLLTLRSTRTLRGKSAARAGDLHVRSHPSHAVCVSPPAAD